MTAPEKASVPRPLIEKRQAWLRAIRAGDIEAALTSDGRAYPPRFGSPELQESDLDFEIAQHLEEAAPVLYEQYKREHNEAHDSRIADYRTWLRDARLARLEEMTFFCASPVEAMLLARNLEGLEDALDDWAKPERRFNRAYGTDRSAGWMSQKHLPAEASLEPARRLPLVCLASLRWDEAALNILVRAGLCPAGTFAWAEAHDAILRLADEVKAGKEGLLPKVFDLYGTTTNGLMIAGKILARQASLGQELEQAFDPKGYKSGGRKKAFKLLEDAAPVDYYPLARATEEGDIDMLEALFAAGGDPNSLSKTGVPMLATLTHAPQAAVAIWLEHGACPLMLPDPDSPEFGSDSCPSPLMQAVWEGNADLTRLLLEQSAISPAITYVEDEETSNPMAELAKERGHKKLASYLKDYAARMKA